MVAGALLAILLAAAGDEVSVRAEVDARKVGLEDVVELTITLSGRELRLAQEPAPPPLTNLRVVGGPSVSTQMSIFNASISQARVYTYVLKPTAVGKAEVGAVRIKLADGEKTTAPIPIEVVEGRIKPRQRTPADPFGRDPFEEDPFASVFGGRERRQEPKLLVEAIPNRSGLHVGEPLLLTYYLYTQTSVSGLEFVEVPQFPGFWSEELPRQEQPPAGESATVAGESYRRFPLFHKLLFPTKSGKLVIPPARMRVGLAPQGFFGHGVVERATKPVSIEVAPIPEEAGFSGAVGRFRASATVDRSVVPLGDAVTLRFRVEGSGNLKWVDKGPEPKVAGVKLYPPQVKSDLKASPSGIEGSKTWEFVVMPETGGTIDIPSMVFAYFDPTAGKIVRAESTPLRLQVEVAAGQAAPAAPLPRVATSGATRFVLRSDLDVPGRLAPDLRARTLVMAMALTILAHGLIWAGPRLAFWKRRVRRPTVRRGSARTALADLDRAGRGGITKEAAASLIEKALHDAFGPLDEGDAADEAMRAAREVLDQVQFLRYAPQLGDYSEQIREVAGRAADVVRKWA